MAIIITGPTASGKTGLSYRIAESIPSEIINADVGQFYTPLTIGTAKPQWKESLYDHHLFDVINDTQDINAYHYRKLILSIGNDILQKNKTPLIVGGSLFYIKSLFFPPKMLILQERLENLPNTNINQNQWWEFLYSIDPERASQLHKNDLYRIKRAITIWQTTGQKPSLYKPEFSPLFNTLIVVLTPSRDTLKQAIQKRTIEMIEGGWIEEAKNLLGTPWESFLKTKGLIGYNELFDWIRSGAKNTTLPHTIEKIQQQTWQYAKRQLTFLNSFLISLNKSFKSSNFYGNILTVSSIHDTMINDMISDWKKMRSKIKC